MSEQTVEEYVYVQGIYGCGKLHLPSKYPPDLTRCGLWHDPMRTLRFTSPVNQEAICKRCLRAAPQGESR